MAGRGLTSGVKAGVRGQGSPTGRTGMIHGGSIIQDFERRFKKCPALYNGLGVDTIKAVADLVWGGGG